LRAVIFDFFEFDIVKSLEKGEERLFSNDREEETKGFGSSITDLGCCIVETLEKEI